MYAIALRGHIEQSCNLVQLLKLQSKDMKSLEVFMRNSKSFTYHAIQNEIMQMLSHAVLPQIIADVKKLPNFCLVADETTDESRKEQLSLCLRYVVNLELVQEFIRLCETADTQANVLPTFFETYLCDLGWE